MPLNKETKPIVLVHVIRTDADFISDDITKSENLGAAKINKFFISVSIEIEN